MRSFFGRSHQTYAQAKPVQKSDHRQVDAQSKEVRRATTATHPQHSAGCGPIDGDREVSWLCILALGLDGQLRGLAETRVGHLVVQHVHDGLELQIGHILAVDRLHHPTVLHASNEGLALRVTRVPALVYELLCHGAVAIGSWLVPQHSEGSLLEDRLPTWPGGLTR